MRILLASDLHYTLRQYDWIASQADRFDAVVIAGDHLDVVGAVPADAQIVAIRTTLAHLAERSRLVTCSGNHDLNALNAAGEKTADWLEPLRERGAIVDGDTATIGDTTFSVLPWWDGDVARAGVEAQLEAAEPERAGRWVWVYHSPPQGLLSWTGSRHFGDPALAGWIDRWTPEVVLTGHIHQSPFTEDGSWVDQVGSTWLFNAGKQIGDVPARIELDLGTAEALWVSLAGEERRSFELRPVAQ
ncbi:MAG: metallophosphoesterase family protein [Actinomycetota bacterium]